MPPRSRSKWYSQPRLWLEAFIVVNIAFLSLDIWLAHSVNQFAHPAESIPFYFSAVAPPRPPGGGSSWAKDSATGPPGATWATSSAGWRWPSEWPGDLPPRKPLLRGADDQKPHLRRPVRGPLAYTGLGLLLIVNRMVPDDTSEVALLGPAHGPRRLLRQLPLQPDGPCSKWFLPRHRVDPGHQQRLRRRLSGHPISHHDRTKIPGPHRPGSPGPTRVGLLGAYYHFEADWNGPAPTLTGQPDRRSPRPRPLLFPNLVLLAGIAALGSS